MTWAIQHGGAGSELYRKRRGAETRCAAEADAVITSSETMKAELRTRGIDAARIEVVPQIVDTAAFNPGSAPPSSRAPTASRGASSWDPSPRSATGREWTCFCARWRAARPELPQLAALIVGDGPERASLERLASELGIAGAVVFSGRVGHDRAPDHYALLDLFAVPRRDLEVCRTVTPLKPFESLAMGVPVVASDLPALRELADDSVAVRLVPPDDPDALAREIVTLAADPSRRGQLSARAREYVFERHGRDRGRAALSSAISRLPAQLS